METYKKLLEYEGMLRDGVISEAEFQKLKSILYSEKMSELGIEDEAEFEDYLKKDVFREAVLMLEKNTVSSHREAISWLERLGDWGNAASVIEQCMPELRELEKQEELERAEKAREELYDSALQKLSKKTLASHNEAIKDLESLGDWKDAKDIAERSKLELPDLEKKDQEIKQEIEKKKQKTKKALIIAAIIAACLIAFVIINENVIKPNRQYSAAVELYEQGKYDDAIAAFEALGGYKDSEEQIQLCKDAKNEEIYVKAKNLYNSGSYEQARNLFDSIRTYKDSKTQIQLCTDAIHEDIYKQAKECISSGDYRKAKELLSTVGTYKDAKDLISKCDAKIEEQLEKEYGASLIKTIKNAKAGDVIKLGKNHYSENGEEDIEWIVLDKYTDRNALFLVSKDIIAYKKFNDKESSDVTWENSSLRAWLNGEFFDRTFSEKEKKAIPTVVNEAEKNPYYTDVRAFEQTNDKVFILSSKEQEAYFKYGEAGLDPLQYTDGAYEQWQNDYDLSLSMDILSAWLRNPGNGLDKVLYYENGDGGVEAKCAYEITFGDYYGAVRGVRPAILVEIGSY